MTITLDQSVANRAESASQGGIDGHGEPRCPRLGGGRVRRFLKWSSIVLAGMFALLAVVVVYSDRQTEADIQGFRDRVEVIGAGVPSPVYEAEANEQLPEPVQRYFDYVFVETPAPHAFVEITMAGDFRRPLTDGFNPTTAEQTIAVGTPSLMFSARTNMIPGIWARAYDFYAEGSMEMKAKVLSTLTVVDESETPELNEMSLRRWLLESPLYPAALLPGGPVRWEPIDDTHAHRLPGGRSMSLNSATLLLATVLVGLSAGFFFTYEASVTLGLAEVSDVAYVEVVQAINETVRNSAFGIVFFGSIPAIALAIATNWKTTRQIPRTVMAAALPFYLAGLIITGTGNVPLNNDLADIANITPEVASQARADFEDDWNRLNLLRTLVIGASFVCLATASIVINSGDDETEAAAVATHTG